MMYMATMADTELAQSSKRVDTNGRGQEREGKNKGPGPEVGLTVLGESLNDSTDDHDAAAAKDGPSTAKAIVDPRDEGQGEARTEGIGGSDDAIQSTLRMAEVYSGTAQVVSELLVTGSIRLKTGGDMERGRGQTCIPSRDRPSEGR